MNILNASFEVQKFKLLNYTCEGNTKTCYLLNSDKMTLIYL